MTRSTHLSDDRLVEVCLEASATAAEQAHLQACDRCSGRHARLENLLSEIKDAGKAEADQAFPAERLDTQRARILSRIDHEGRPARVITFPAASPSDVRPLRARPTRRWIAVAAAAGLVIGLLAGHLSRDFGTTPSRPPTQIASARAASTVRAASTPLSDDEFLGQVEIAGSGPRLAALRSLNELTPR